MKDSSIPGVSGVPLTKAPDRWSIAKALLTRTAMTVTGGGKEFTGTPLVFTRDRFGLGILLQDASTAHHRVHIDPLGLMQEGRLTGWVTTTTKNVELAPLREHGKVIVACPDAWMTGAALIDREPVWLTVDRRNRTSRPERVVLRIDEFRIDWSNPTRLFFKAYLVNPAGKPINHKGEVLDIRTDSLCRYQGAYDFVRPSGWLNPTK